MIHNIIVIPILGVAIDWSVFKVEGSPLYSLVVIVTLNVVANEIVSRLITTDTRPEDSWASWKSDASSNLILITNKIK